MKDTIYKELILMQIAIERCRYFHLDANCFNFSEGGRSKIIIG